MNFRLRRMLTLMTAGAITALLAAHAAPSRPDLPRTKSRPCLPAMEKSGCEFYRNGSWHTATDGRAHLARKLAEVEKRHPPRAPMNSSRWSPRASSISGEPYRVRCPGVAPIASAVWFRQTLERSRQTARQLASWGSAHRDWPALRPMTRDGASQRPQRLSARQMPMSPEVSITLARACSAASSGSCQPIWRSRTASGGFRGIGRRLRSRTQPLKQRLQRPRAHDDGPQEHSWPRKHR